MRVRLWITALLLPAAICLSATAQTQSPAKKPTGVIAGRVTAGGKPVANVMIALQKPYSPESAIMFKLTDQEGQFQFTDVAAGQYQVTPRTLAYVYQSGTNPFRGGVSVTLEDGESVTDVDIALTRGGVITGRVTDAEGRPVIGEMIYLLSANERGEFRSNMLYFSPVKTDDRGIYRAFGLPAGHYIVGVGRDGNAVYMSPGAQNYYRRTYHPEAVEQAKAKVLNVSEGAEVAGIDIVAGRLVKGYSVAGRIIDEATGKPVPNAAVLVGMIKDNQLSSIVGGGNRSDASGNFRIDGLTPARYSVLTMRQEDVYSDPVTIEIEDKNITGVEIRMKRGVTVTGVVTIEGTDDPAIRSKLSHVQLIPFLVAEGVPGFATPTAINPDGSFRISGLQAGKLTFQVIKTETTKNLSLLRVEHDGVVQTGGITISAGVQVQNVRVVLGYGTGSVRGQIKVENGELPPDVQVRVALLLPGGNMQVPPVLVDRRGRFFFEGVAPGEYEVSVLLISLATQGKPISFKPVKEKVHVTSGSESQVVMHLDLGQTQKEDR